MKKTKENRSNEHSVETPTPPQVMNPSSPPDKQKDKTGKSNAQPNKKDTDKKTGQPLAPREEL
jgi:hypothetical protein